VYSRLTLFLFMAWVFANYADDVLAAYNLARFAQSFYRCSDFHFLLFGLFDDESFLCR